MSPERRRRRRRRDDPLSAAAMLGRFRRRAGAPAPDGPVGTAAAAWPAVVGEAAAARSVPVRMTRAGVLTVACADAAWAHELTMRRDELLRRLHDERPGTPVTGMRFSVADNALPAPPPPPARAPRPVVPDASHRAFGEAVAADLEDPELRALAARALAASAARRTRPTSR